MATKCNVGTELSPRKQTDKQTNTPQTNKKKKSNEKTGKTQMKSVV